MHRSLPAVLLALLAIAVPWSRAVAREDLFGPGYPVDVEVSYTAGLFQWIDSLANTTVGKTAAAHRRDFVRRWGKPNTEDSALIVRFAKARLAHAVATQDRSAILGIFCEASSVDAAVTAASKSLTTDDAAGLAAAVLGLAPKYKEIWDGGSVPRAFVTRVAKDRRRAEVGSLLARIARFYGSDLSSAKRPRLVLVPVPDGWGTHAQAVGKNLLLEIRAGDDLAEQAAVIVHENSHFLFDTAPQARRDALAQFAASKYTSGDVIWGLLGEALPTAFGQGIADQTFRPNSWSQHGAWYHRQDVDGYAKALHAAANHALAAGLHFDEAFVRHAILIWVQKEQHGSPEILGMETVPPQGERPATPR